MTGAGRCIRPVALSDHAWAPFGWLPVEDTDPRDGSERLFFKWADPHVNVIGHRRDEVPAVAGGLRCEILYRHDTHTQTIMPLDTEAVIAVAPADETFDEASSWKRIVAFWLHPLEAIVLHRGTWHWGPFPTAAEAVRLFNVQALRYPEDNVSVDLAARGLSVEVLTTVS